MVCLLDLFWGVLRESGSIAAVVGSVLELGAAGALPSLVAACNGASKVVITDYPEKMLIDMMDENVKKNLTEDLIKDKVYVMARTLPPSLPAPRVLPTSKGGYSLTHSSSFAIRAICGALMCLLCLAVWVRGGSLI